MDLMECAASIDTSCNGIRVMQQKSSAFIGFFQKEGMKND
jgi:hypothetical protein